MSDKFYDSEYFTEKSVIESKYMLVDIDKANVIFAEKDYNIDDFLNNI